MTQVQVLLSEVELPIREGWIVKQHSDTNRGMSILCFETVINMRLPMILRAEKIQKILVNVLFLKLSSVTSIFTRLMRLLRRISSGNSC
jgi:hypothetical protein